MFDLWIRMFRAENEIEMKLFGVTIMSVKK